MRNLSALLLAPALVAQAPPTKVHKVERLSPHAYAIQGQGGNIGLFVGERDAVLVDTQFARLVPGLLEAIASVTDKPIRFLVNTHHHGDHVGGNPLVAPRVQAIIAHANVKARMVKDQERLPADQRGGLPTLLVGESDPAKPARLDIDLPGLSLHLVHRSAAHTDGDLVVGFPQEKVLHMGDLFFLGMLPYVDTRSGGGRFAGLLETVTWFASWVPEDVKIIPGHGPLCGRKELLRYRDFLQAVADHAKAHPGKSDAELAATFKGEAWPEWKPREDFVNWEALFGAVTGRGPGRVVRN